MLATTSTWPSYGTADGMMFSTCDKNNDPLSSGDPNTVGHIAKVAESGWWYNYLSGDVDLNREYGTCYWRNTVWKEAPLTFSEMKLRQRHG